MRPSRDRCSPPRPKSAPRATAAARRHRRWHVSRGTGGRPAPSRVDISCSMRARVNPGTGQPAGNPEGCQTVAGGRSVAETSGKGSAHLRTLEGCQRLGQARLSPLRGEVSLFAACPKVAFGDLRPLSCKPLACQGDRGSCSCPNSWARARCPCHVQYPGQARAIHVKVVAVWARRHSWAGWPEERWFSCSDRTARAIDGRADPPCSPA